MRKKLLKVFRIIAVAAAIVMSLWFVKHERDRREAAKRERGYQTVHGQYAAS